MIARICIVLVAAGGCVTPMSQLRGVNRQLEAELVELRADHRAQDRKIRDLQDQLALAKENTVAPEVPQLPVEVVAPPPASTDRADQRVVGVAADGEEIVYEGDAAHAPPPAPERYHERDAVPVVADRLEVTHHIPPVAARVSHVRSRDAGDDTAGDAYRAAVELVRSGKYDDAQTALRSFLAKYPRHEYADHAQYWLGENFYAQKDYAHALGEFRATIETYPRGTKVPDALLKEAYCYQALGQADKARAALEQVVSLYPKSEPAVLATKRLDGAGADQP